MGPLLFSLTLHSYLQHLSSGFCVAYMDDVSIGGSLQSVFNYLVIMRILVYFLTPQY